ncbi:MAG: NADH dehydrogenase [Phycisphaerae bacterium SM23_30]|nr:MAG: NADH dehydrogenase [Phycisphaerae bacterium SM23_30]
MRIGLGSCCVSRGSGKLHAALKEALAQTRIPVPVKRVGCVGMCHQTPLLEIVLPDQRSFLYARVQPQDARPIVLRHFRPKSIAKKINNKLSVWFDNLLTDHSWPPVTRYSIDVRDEPVAAFLNKQKHLATECGGRIDPTDLDEYRAHGGFEALNHCLTNLTPEKIIDEIKRSNLRGRGGAGYPTGLKWSHVRNQKSEQKFVICNGDEGDPGAFMDRMLLESYPYRIIEGITIAAYAVGASRGYFYIRAEYPLAVRRVREALEICRENNLIGRSILGGNFNLDLRIMEGAGAFVCGEESALMASIEGRRGMPRLRPPYPAQKGLWQKPTLVNNVETYALIPWIIRNGSKMFAQLGSDHSSGTKVFALAGKIARGGLIEVPMGITIREIVEDIGGGIAHDKKFKAVQIGGPSGGCVPAGDADTTVDFEALTAAGAIMGSGGLVVLDETDCMVDIARYFLEFTQNQSCGRCTFCRIGTRRMLDILERLCAGRGKKGDLEELHDLAVKVKNTSLCALGGTAPNPVLSTLQYFRDEYEAHLQGRCPAGKCRALITYSVTDDCIGCTICAQNCPAEAIAVTPYERHEIDPEKCIRCGTCREICPVDAVEVT